MSRLDTDSITITVSKHFHPKMWQVLHIGTTQQWSIVTDFEKDYDNLSCSLTTTPINLSKWKWVRNFQIWMLNKIFKTNKPT